MSLQHLSLRQRLLIPLCLPLSLYPRYRRLCLVKEQSLMEVFLCVTDQSLRLVLDPLQK